MRINPVNNLNFFMPKVSFGEYDGDFYDYSPHTITKSQYEAKKDIINEKYNNMRSSWLRDCDDLEIDNSAVWSRLNEIEKLRNRDLSALSREYRV